MLSSPHPSSIAAWGTDVVGNTCESILLETVSGNELEGNEISAWHPGTETVNPDPSGSRLSHEIEKVNF